MLTRSPAEIAFRLRQEGADLWLYLCRPEFHAEVETTRPCLPGITPVVSHLQGSRLSGEIMALADAIAQHRLPLLGRSVDTGAEIDWRRDYINRVSSQATYFRRIPYLDAKKVGDHKWVWELNRHQHLVVLAQAYRLSGRGEYARELRHQLSTWLDANPYLRGINWTSALEVGFRALSWMWIFHLSGDCLVAAERQRFLTALYQHGLYLEHNLSVYFSPNTHLLGEAVALHALGTVFPEFPGADRWATTGHRIVLQQMELQVRDDGSHFEQSSYYHLYSTDLFLLHAVLAQNTPEAYRKRLACMAEYLDALMGPQGSIPLIGDDDGGRVFHPYGPREQFGRATLATCGAFLGRKEWIRSTDDLQPQAVWWLGEKALQSPAGRETISPSRNFACSGIVVMTAGDAHVVVDAGSFGYGSAGHSHSDSLGIVVRAGEEELLIDPGTYTYSDPAWRESFRGSAAHNTVRIDGRDQATAVNPFRWENPPQVRILEWTTSAAEDFLKAECRYEEFHHVRSVIFRKPDLLLICDDVEGPAGTHDIEQFWHAGGAVRDLGDGAFQLGGVATLVLEPAAASVVGDGWRSRIYGTKEPAPVIRALRKTSLPVQFRAALDWSGQRTLDEIRQSRSKAFS